MSFLPPTLQVKLDQQVYIQGCCVNGEVVLTVSQALAFPTQVDLQVWGEERCRWREENESPGRTPARGVSSRMGPTSSNYQGNCSIFNSTSTLHRFKDNVLEAGRYMIPFAFQLPFQTPGTTKFESEYIRIQIGYFLEARFVVANQSNAEDLDATDRPNSALAVRSKDNFTILRAETRREFGAPPGGTPDCLARTELELVVIEKPTLQSAKHPYTYECAYTIPAIFFRSRELLVKLPSGQRAVIAGGVLPLCLEVANQSRSQIAGVTVYIINKLSMRRSSGDSSYRTIHYLHTQLHKPIFMPSRKKHVKTLHLSLLIPLPATLAPTSHGKIAECEWECAVSFRYKGRFSLFSSTTDRDLVIPLTVWPKNELTYPDCDVLTRVIAETSTVPVRILDSAGALFKQMAPAKDAFLDPGQLLVPRVSLQSYSDEGDNSDCPPGVNVLAPVTFQLDDTFSEAVVTQKFIQLPTKSALPAPTLYMRSPTSAQADASDVFIEAATVSFQDRDQTQSRYFLSEALREHELLLQWTKDTGTSDDMPQEMTHFGVVGRDLAVSKNLRP